MVYLWLRRCRWKPIAEIQVFLDEALPRIFGGCSLTQIAFVAALAGVAEEALFRGLIQSWLAAHTGVPLAVVLSSIVFDESTQTGCLF